MRNYMLAYLGIEMAKAKQTDGSMQHSADLDLTLPEMSVQLVERLVKVYKSPHKCHRNIKDSEKKFLKSVAEWMNREDREDREETIVGSGR